MKLVIVESPNKIKTLQKYFGKDYTILASYGHIADLSKKNGMGIDFDNNFKPKYVLLDDKVKVLQEILDAAAKSDQIFLASDKDREGEAISYHLSRYLLELKKPISRLDITEITKKGVDKALKNPRDINLSVFKSQESRRILDRIVGFMVSPFLINFFGPHLSAGRVQSVACRMVADREKEIESFKPEEFWNIKTNFIKDGMSFSSKYDGKLKNKSEVDNVINIINKSSQFFVKTVDSSEKNEYPPKPLITSKLQQIMAKKYSFDAERTMKAAQSLYEVGYCTYIRTDSVRISDDAINEAKEYLDKNNLATPLKNKKYSASKDSQDAHECIRPTDLNVHPDKSNLLKDERLVYKTIWQYFIASQMCPAIWDTLEVKITPDNNNKIIFKSSGKSLKYKGFLEIFNFSDESKIEIPSLKKSDELKIDDKTLLTEQKFTQPAARYNDASLLKELENKQIGRPATYAEILKKIADRKYVEKKGNTYYITELGSKINKILINLFSFLEYNYTANLEKELDDIESGKLDQLTMLKKFFDAFSVQLKDAYIKYGCKICGKCGGPMIERTNSKTEQKFFACINYPKCWNTISDAA
jgi:DNA topoisomerase-1